MSSQKRRDQTPLTAYWDTSAIVSLCCFQSQTSGAVKAARLYARQVTWWITAVEAIGAFNRLHRESNLTSVQKQQALDRLSYLRNKWSEIQPGEEVRDTAERLLGFHKLRAADAFQLSAALVWCKHRPRGRILIAADGGLAAAAESEGFAVIRIA